MEHVPSLSSGSLEDWPSRVLTTSPGPCLWEAEPSRDGWSSTNWEPRATLYLHYMEGTSAVFCFSLIFFIKMVVEQFVYEAYN